MSVALRIDNESVWLVCSETGGLSPNPYHHPSEQSAFVEAQRLCRIHGGKFYILEVRGLVERTDIHVHRLKRDDSIPF